ncbi:tRNA1(Val) (adenine(37)-N6)-methyltransferase [Anaerotignum sp. MB30-C6]|uniref:tRNA1(Val) (adenine(37)-N6)-methyltransferase n=1 Tax=Anaerotignum sp. MB30-C6 TaxID=3070814 RepID=UPI0027DB9E54|nr:tRNA1(Val) (adenine(37)-N6)-methyltransferase [Anaerotignum sp. MB30-C6]WMI81463.1 tRNA1(Val) (adenine(37)-N6)-methyltransferase [Anaerotignum sp. MB30-C6]
MKTEIKINEFERLDDLHRKGYKIIQDPKRFCFGIDAVLLSGFAKVKKGETLLDLGTGTGIIPILLEAKTLGAHFTGLEVQEESAKMAKRSVALNQLEEKVTICHGDLKQIKDLFPEEKFDVVTSNPPYMNEGGGLMNPHSAKAIARHEVLCTLEDVVAAAGKVLRVGGRFYMIHRPHRLTDIMVFFRQYKLEPKRVRFIQPFSDKAPTMVLVEGVKGGNPGVKVDAPLIVYSEAGKYTQEVYEIYYGEGQA